MCVTSPRQPTSQMYIHTELTVAAAIQVIKAVLDPFEEAPSDSQLYAAYQVSLQFLRDFEKSGIHLPQSKKEQFVALNNDILTHGWHFITASTTDESDSSSTMNKQKALLGHPSSDVRRQAWVRLHNHPTAIASLESLLQSRSELAHLLGYQDYASLALSDKMANTPQAVWRFLDATNAANQERAQADTAYLASLRGLDSVAPWDRDFCTMVVPNPHAPPLSPFFSVGTCIQGLSRLFSRLFGISLHYAPRPEEWMWDEQVRRMEVRDDQSGQVLGCIYMDLFARDGKAPNAAHYTVQCARKRSWDDVEGDRRYVHPSDMPAQQHEILRKPDPNEEKQLPVVVLSLDFGQRSQGPTTLMWQQVETLFHEMGHALHCERPFSLFHIDMSSQCVRFVAMLGQSDFQNVSGTRCATDFVELPSILMEHFCASPEVLSLYARHWETDQPLPLDVFAAHQASHQRLSGLEQAHQVTLSALDLAYHTQHQRNDEGWSTPAAWDVLTQYGPPGSSGGGAASTGAAWQMRFTHLASYGATYYAYLLDRAVASRVWSHLFVPGVRREAGEQYRDKVLRWGGGKDPWHCLGDALESDEIWKGGDRAMALVGDPTTQ